MSESPYGSDELASWADDSRPVVRALRAPGTTAELASEEQYVAAFREARGPAPKVRSLPRRAAAGSVPHAARPSW